MDRTSGNEKMAKKTKQSIVELAARRTQAQIYVMKASVNR
jgi:hypothetical protein